MMDYLEFLERKAIIRPPVGIADPGPMPDYLFPFQQDITRWALTRGQAAIFAGTGLGKTRMQLTWADIVARHTQKPTLILTPLAVAQQTCGEAARIGVGDVRYLESADGPSPAIAVTNYDRVEKFDPKIYGAVVLDESSIIKSHDGKTRAALMAMFAGTPFKLCCTATPSPNDYVELGQHSEFLGVMTQKEMLATFFVHDGSIRATNVGNHGGKPVADWRLKRHAEGAFWRWLASWGAVVRHPRDLGYDQDGYDLPPMLKHFITVPSSQEDAMASGQLFAAPANTLKERQAAKRGSIDSRAVEAAKIVNAAPDRPWLIWCHLNDEADALKALIPDAVEVRGPDDRAQKMARLTGFRSCNPRVLLSKPSIAGFGMDWSHCADMVFVGLNDSFEQLFQAIRRCWRFGQAKPVNVYLIASELEGNVMANLKEKEEAHEAMMTAMAEHMRDLVSANIRAPRVNAQAYSPTQPMELPKWMA